MKVRSVAVSLLGCLLLLGAAGTALASNDAVTGFFKINQLHTKENSPGYLIDPDGSVVQATNPGCPNTLFYEPQAGHSAEYYERMNTTILAAFLAGKKIELEVNGTSELCGPNGYPAYEQVRVHQLQ